MYIAPDTNVVNDLGINCFKSRNKVWREKCMQMKGKIIREMKNGECIILPGFFDEYCSYLGRNIDKDLFNAKFKLYDYIDMGDERKLIEVAECSYFSPKGEEKKEFVDMFLNELSDIAREDKSFYELCTQQDSDSREENIRKSRDHDWKAIANAFVAGRDTEILSSDTDVVHSYCVSVYTATANKVKEMLRKRYRNLSTNRVRFEKYRKAV